MTTLYFDASNKILSLFGENFLRSIEAKEFKTQGNDQQFQIPKNNTGGNLVKVAQQEDGSYTIKFFDYRPFKHKFEEKVKMSNIQPERLKEAFKDATGFRNSHE